MTEKQKLRWVYFISAVFIVVNTIFIVNDFYWALLLPLLLIVVLLFIFSLDKIILIITFLTPFAINVRSFDIGIGVSVPTEPLMLGVLLVFFLKLFYENTIDKKLLRHPVTIAILINLAWIFITSLTSELPLVSFKFLLARLWFIVPFYFIGVKLFKKFENINLFLWLYIIALSVVIFYSLYNHALTGFEEDPGHVVMTPFYNDHTVYGAVLALFLPFIFVSIFNSENSGSRKFTISAVFVLFVVALIFSYSRAAWLSVAAAVFVYFIILLKIKFKWIALFTVVIVSGFFLFQNEIFDKLEKNSRESSTNFEDHLKSITNISSDASNLERINRWQSAIRMFRDHPVMGIGPGTYQFLYAPYQLSKEKTIISTNAGDRGNAHSEYIGPLTESGVLGMLSFLAIVICVLYTAMRVYRRSTDLKVKTFSLVLMLGLVTYYVHGTLNNFLDSDKASVPFWGFTAIIVTLDLYYGKKAGSPQ